MKKRLFAVLIGTAGFAAMLVAHPGPHNPDGAQLALHLSVTHMLPWFVVLLGAALLLRGFRSRRQH